VWENRVEGQRNRISERECQGIRISEGDELCAFCLNSDNLISWYSDNLTSVDKECG